MTIGLQLQPAVPGNTWETVLYDVAPEDAVYVWTDPAVFPSATSVYATVQDRVGGGMWNGTALVEPSRTDWATYAIPGQPDPRIIRAFQYSVPWSIMPERQYTVRLYGVAGTAPAPTDRVLEWRNVNSFTNGRANPDGVVVDCDFGGVNALQVLRGCEPIVDAAVVATVTFPGGTVERARTKTDKDGRWKFPQVLEPGRLHDITFEKVGFNLGRVQITPGASQ